MGFDKDFCIIFYSLTTTFFHPIIIATNSPEYSYATDPHTARERKFHGKFLTKMRVSEKMIVYLEETNKLFSGVHAYMRELSLFYLKHYQPTQKKIIFCFYR